MRAKPVLAGFDRILSEAAAGLERAAVFACPAQVTQSGRDCSHGGGAVRQTAGDDEAGRFGGRAYMADVEAQLRRQGVEFTPRYPLQALPEFGWSPEQLRDKGISSTSWKRCRKRLRVATSAVVDDVAILLADFQIDLDRSSASYRELGTQALMAYVRALQALEKRNAGEPIATEVHHRSPELH